MATEIMQTKEEQNESDKKHMGMDKYKLLKKVEKTFYRKNGES